MGLESVELVMEVEETFGFSIPDEDAAALDTVGKLYDYVMANRFAGRPPGCLTSIAFYKLRRALISVLGIGRNDVQLSSCLTAIIPTHRRRRWLELHKAMGLRLPELVRPRWVTAVAIAVGCALVIDAATIIGIVLAFWIIWPVAFALYFVTEPLAVVFPRECATVGGLTEAILRKNYGAISDECQRSNAEDVWRTLRDLIAEQLGIRPDDVRKEASFVKDVGVD